MLIQKLSKSVEGMSKHIRHGINHVADNINHVEQQNDKQHNHHQSSTTPHQQPVSNNYNVNLQYDPIPPEAGKTEKLILSLTGYNVVHDKVMHLIIVREYLSHLHLKTMASS
jgi:hypothetical protein